MSIRQKDEGIWINEVETSWEAEYRRSVKESQMKMNGEILP